MVVCVWVGRGSLSYIETTRVVGQVLHPFPLFALYIKHTRSTRPRLWTCCSGLGNFALRYFFTFGSHFVDFSSHNVSEVTDSIMCNSQVVLCAYTIGFKNRYHAKMLIGEWVHFQGKQLFHVHFCLPSESDSPKEKKCKEFAPLEANSYH